MAEDHTEERMNFIIEQQARFAVDMQLLQQSVKELGQKQAHTDDMLRGLVDVSMSLARHVEEMDQRLNRLADFQEHSDQRLDMVADLLRQHLESHHGVGGKRLQE